MTGADRSLLTFLDAPVVVGDPEGCAAFVNPAFEARFGVSQADARGKPLAELFEGGAREAVLRAVAKVCQHGQNFRFRLREGEVGFSAVASPIEAQGTNVGVVILLKEEVEGLERMMALHREIRDPIDDLGQVLDRLLEQTGGRRDENYRALLEDGRRALSRIRRWSDELKATISGERAPSSSESTFDPSDVAREVSVRAAREVKEIGTRILLLAPASLPEVRGDADRVEAVLLGMIRERIEGPTPPVSITVAARVSGAGDQAGIILSITERSESGGYASPPTHSPVLQEMMAPFQNAMHTVPDPQLGRCTVIRFPIGA